MACCSVLSKISIAFVSILFWAVAGVLIFLSTWIFIEYTRYGHVTDIASSSLLPGTILLAVGIVLFLLGLLGCIGAVKENKCLMGCYFSLLLLALLGLACGVGLAYMYRTIINRDLHDVMLKGLKKYDSNDTVIREAIDEMQEELHCCGVDNYTDWFVVRENYPSSCCRNRYNSTIVCDKGDDLYKKGCYTEMREAFIGHIMAIYCVIAACAVMLLIALISACFLMRSRHPTGFIYRDLSDTEGMHV